MRVNHKIIGALWFFNLTNYADRMAMAFAGPVIISSLSLNSQSFGIILSAFSIGYALAQIPGGLLADRWGAKWFLVIPPLLWALFTGMTAFMITFAGFVFVRVCLGMSEGLSSAAHISIIGDNFDPKQRSGAFAASLSASAIAPAITGPLVGIIIASQGWQAVFGILMILPLVAAALNFVVLPAGRPMRPEPVSQDATIYHKDGASIVGLLRLPSLWLLAFAYFCFSITFWGYMGWMPSYLASARHLDIQRTGLLGGIPHIFSFAGLVVVGSLGTIIHRAKPLLIASCHILAGVSLYFAFRSETLPGAMTGLCGAAFFLYGGVPSFTSLMTDLAPEQKRASYAAIVMTVGLIGSIIAPTVIGYLVQKSGTYASCFQLMEASLLAAAAGILITGISDMRRKGQQ